MQSEASALSDWQAPAQTELRDARPRLERERQRGVATAVAHINSKRRKIMANKYSKGNFVPKEDDKKEKKEPPYNELSVYEKKRKRLEMAAKILAIVLAASMVIFYVISAGLFAMN